MLPALPLLVGQLVRQSPFRQISGAANEATVVALLPMYRSPAPIVVPSVPITSVVPMLNHPEEVALPETFNVPRMSNVEVGVSRPIPTFPASVTLNNVGSVSAAHSTLWITLKLASVPPLSESRLRRISFELLNAM